MNTFPDDLYVALHTCDGQQLKRAITAAFLWFERHAEAVNRLNVFPVPDGDTGTNMLLTLQAALGAIAHLESAHAGEVAVRLAYGALHGSRGNSGTALSQLFNGFAESVRHAAQIDAQLLSHAFQNAVRAAYDTFVKPMEGTILTVARGIAEAAERAAAQSSDLRVMLTECLNQGRDVLNHTPEMLPILKQAGVVDSGGMGLVVLFEGVARLLNGHSGDVSDVIVIPESLDLAALDAAFALSDEADEDGFGYDVQYIITGKNLDVDRIRAEITALGHSPIVIGTAEAVKVHVHVPDPQLALSYGEQQGALSDIVVENMQEQSGEYRTLRAAEADRASHVAVISVSFGDGLTRVFREFGAHVIPGGQTMNPSVGEFLAAIKATRAARAVLLPNNPNVILSARQAAMLAQTELNCEVQVIPTRTIPQGISAMVAWSEDGDFERIVADMIESSTAVHTGEITIATRDVTINGVHAEAGRFIGLIDDQLAVNGAVLDEVVLSLLEGMQADQYEVISLYYGAEITAQVAEDVAEMLRVRYPDQTVEMLWGGQPYYHFIIGIE